MGIPVVEAESVVTLATANNRLETLRHEGHRVSKDATTVQAATSRAFPKLVAFGSMEEFKTLIACYSLVTTQLFHIFVSRHTVTTDAEILLY